MIPNHEQFIEAISKQQKVCLRFYSKADSGVIDLVCAPLDYGPGEGIQDGVNRNWIGENTATNGTNTNGKFPNRVLDIRALGPKY